MVNNAFFVVKSIEKSKQFTTLWGMVGKSGEYFLVRIASRVRNTRSEDSKRVRHGRLQRAS